MRFWGAGIIPLGVFTGVLVQRKHVTHLQLGDRSGRALFLYNSDYIKLHKQEFIRKLETLGRVCRTDMFSATQGHLRISIFGVFRFLKGSVNDSVFLVSIGGAFLEINVT